MPQKYEKICIYAKKAVILYAKLLFFMRKHLFIGIVALLAICLTSCKEEAPECAYHSDTLDLTVLHEDWQFDDGTMQFYYHFDVPEITAQVYNYGNWTICREYNAGGQNAYQVALPQSIYMAENVVDPVTRDTSVVYYTQHIDYRLGIGFVEIQLTNSDYFYSPEKPEDMSFRLQLIY